MVFQNHILESKWFSGTVLAYAWEYFTAGCIPFDVRAVFSYTAGHAVPAPEYRRVRPIPSLAYLRTNLSNNHDTSFTTSRNEVSPAKKSSDRYIGCVERIR